MPVKYRPSRALARLGHAKHPIVCGLHSTLLDQYGFRHAFSTRLGGVSAAPYDSLNLGFHLGDDEVAVRENRTRFAESLGLGIDRLFEQRQVHGTRVRVVSDVDARGIDCR